MRPQTGFCAVAGGDCSAAGSDDLGCGAVVGRAILARGKRYTRGCWLPGLQLRRTLQCSVFWRWLASVREANGRRIWRAKPVRGCVRQHNICRRSVCALRAPGDSGAPIRARLSRPPQPVARLAMLWCIPVTRRSRVILSKIHANTLCSCWSAMS